MATIYKRKEDKGKAKACWYFGYKDENGRQRTKKGYTDRKATHELAEKLEREARRRRDGLVDPAEEKLAEQRKAPIDEVVDLYEKSLKSRRTTDKHVSLTLSRVRRIITGCSFQILVDIETDAVQTYLDKVAKEEDFGHRTYNHYVQAIDGFGNWLVSTKRTAFNPFAGLTRLNVEVDIRHPRRALSVEEVGRLIASARASGKSIQCFTPEERARIYILSGLTGLRRKEIASLTPRSFNLKSDPPTVTVQAACSKHRRTDVLPLHPQLLAMLPGWLRGLPVDEPIFPKLAKRRTWLMVKKDLERIGIPYETPEGIADFHAAGRHSYITGLLTNGATLPEAKELARHTDVKMTMKYAHIGIGDRAKALANLPFQECNRSKPVTAEGHSQTSGGTQAPSKSSSQETTNPGGNRGYVVLCLPETPDGAAVDEWRRRELNPRPEMCRRRLLRA
jgi:integrase/recombinase XerC